MNQKKLSKAEFGRSILTLEAIGFTLLLMLLWICELIDLPHRIFGTVETPINWAESVLESAMLVLLSLLVLFISRRMLCRIACLEGVLHICPVCKSIREAGCWTPFEQFLERDSCTHFTHGLCPDCERNARHLKGIVRKEFAKSLHP